MSEWEHNEVEGHEIYTFDRHEEIDAYLYLDWLLAFKQHE